MTDNAGKAIAYEYLPNGKVTSITYPDDSKMTLDYDDTNRVITKTDFANKRYHLTYNEKDKGLVSEVRIEKNRISFHYGEDDNKIKGQLISRTADYDNAGQTETRFYYGPFKNLAKTTQFNNKTNTIYNTQYYYNPRGQLERLANHSHLGHRPALNSVITYQYDSLNRLVNEMHDQSHLVKSIGYEYDANNNLITESSHDGIRLHTVNHQYNNQDQRVTSTSDDTRHADVLHYTWTKNGHLGKAPGDIAYAYDAQGYLVSVTYPNNDTVTYDYLPNGLLSKRSIDNKNQSFYYGTDKKVTSIRDDETWYSLYRDSKGLQANISDQATDQLFLSNRNTGAILGSNEHFQTTTYTAYGKPVTPFTESEITSSFGWAQEYTDPYAQLTYLQRRFYHSGYGIFINRDTYHVDNHYAFANANPITFADPTGHSPKQALSYGLGGGATALGALGVLLAIPTGGASLTLSAGTAIAAGATQVLAGIALMGSQAALDHGNKEVAKALEYVGISLGIAALVEAGVAIAPIISSKFFASTVIESESFGVTKPFPPKRLFEPEENALGSGGKSTTSATPIRRATEGIFDPVDQSLSPSGESQETIQSSVRSTNNYVEMDQSPVSDVSIDGAPPHTSNSAFSSQVPGSMNYNNTETTIIKSPNPTPTVDTSIGKPPVILGSIDTTKELYVDMTGADRALKVSFSNEQQLPDTPNVD